MYFNDFIVKKLVKGSIKVQNTLFGMMFEKVK